ncbi:MAG: twin-arginine translocation signal domain-containing protein [Phycisphaerae bacterium]
MCEYCIGKISNYGYMASDRRSFLKTMAAASAMAVVADLATPNGARAEGKYPGPQFALASMKLQRIARLAPSVTIPIRSLPIPPLVQFRRLQAPALLFCRILVVKSWLVFLCGTKPALLWGVKSHVLANNIARFSLTPRLLSGINYELKVEVLRRKGGEKSCGEVNRWSFSGSHVQVFWPCGRDGYEKQCGTKMKGG